MCIKKDIVSALTTCPHLPCSGSRCRKFQLLLNEAESEDTVQLLLELSPWQQSKSRSEENSTRNVSGLIVKSSAPSVPLANLLQPEPCYLLVLA